MKKKLMKKNRKNAFTLVELLVAITILGIIIALAIPLIRNIQGNQEKQKVQIYHDSIEQSARIYVDTYGRDGFENEDVHCIIIPLSILIEKDLAKDIQIEEKSCHTENSFVKVEKDKNRYTYETYLSCGKVGASGNIIIDSNISDEEANIAAYLSTCKKIEN
ncbi:MAG: prepilin-type N-terminal cleavage/methylation domain-containing protein [Bacilli bacterium]|nr:prepilin-type N-terminal cleavage/methylation domain-containing protein [Bacilli bacterium]